MHNFIISNADTDSIMFCKPDKTEFSLEEQENLLKELNSLYPEKIKFEHDGIFETVIILKAKNYILYDGKKLKTKGSALRDQKKPVALRELCDEIIKAMIEDKANFSEIYTKYVLEAMNVTNIKRWSTKKGITDKVLNAKRANEQKVLDAIENSEYVEGDKCFVFFKNDESLCLAENFDGDYHVDRLLEKIYKTTKVFEAVLPIDEYFPNYKLKRNKDKLFKL